MYSIFEPLTMSNNYWNKNKLWSNGYVQKYIYLGQKIDTLPWKLYKALPNLHTDRRESIPGSS